MSSGSHFQQTLVEKILRYFFYTLLFRYCGTFTWEMSAESFQGRSLLSPSASSIRANSLPSTPVQNVSVSLSRRASFRGLGSENILSPRESDDSPSIFSQSESSSCAGKVLAEDEVGKHMHDHSCSHLETVDQETITEYEHFFNMVFGPENLEKKEDDDNHAHCNDDKKTSLQDHVEPSEPQQIKSRRSKFQRY